MATRTAGSKHAMGRNAIRTSMERAYRTAEKAYVASVRDAAAGKCFSSARAESKGSRFIGAGDAYASAGRFPIEGGASQERAHSAGWKALDAFSKHCRAAGPLSGMKRGPQRRSRGSRR
jgi:hypothetical protein